MPRRKNVILSQLPPLVFVNSPVFQPAPVLTPDLAVDNPVTARAVPIENLEDNSWVSPQFRSEKFKYLSTRRKHRSLSHTSRQRFDEAGPNGCLKQSKFKPLQFISENSNESGIPTKSVSELRSCSESHKDEHGGLCNDNHTNEGSRISCVGLMSDDMNNIYVNTPEIVQQGECSEVNLNNSSYNNYGMIDSAVMKGTGSIDEQGLLKPQNVFCQNRSANSDVELHEFDLNNHADALQVVRGLITSEMLGDTILKSPNNMFQHLHKECSDDASNSDQIIFVVSHSSGISNNRVSRTPQRSRDQGVILVVDTPECDYGLTFRQRQLKCGSKLKN